MSRGGSPEPLQYHRTVIRVAAFVGTKLLVSFKGPTLTTDQSKGGRAMSTSQAKTERVVALESVSQREHRSVSPALAVGIWRQPNLKRARRIVIAALIIIPLGYFAPVPTALY